MDARVGVEAVAGASDSGDDVAEPAEFRPDTGDVYIDAPVAAFGIDVAGTEGTQSRSGNRCVRAIDEIRKNLEFGVAQLYSAAVEHQAASGQVHHERCGPRAEERVGACAGKKAGRCFAERVGECREVAGVDSARVRNLDDENEFRLID